LGNSWFGDWARGRLFDRIVERWGTARVTVALFVLGLALGCVAVIALRFVGVEHPVGPGLGWFVVLGAFALWRLPARGPRSAYFLSVPIAYVATSLATGGI